MILKEFDKTVDKETLEDFYNGNIDVIIIKNSTAETIHEIGQLEKQDLHGTYQVPIGANQASEKKQVLRQEEDQPWHNDRMYYRDIHSFCGLRAVHVEEGAGDTYFCDMKAAWASLPEDLKEKVKAEGEVEFSLANFFKRARYPYDVQDPRELRWLRIKRRCKNTIYKKDKYGEYAYFSPLYVSSEYFDILNELLFKDEFIYRHKWESGDLIIWNNHTLSHKRDGTPRDIVRDLVRYAFHPHGTKEDFITDLDLEYSRDELYQQAKTFEYKPFQVKRAKSKWFRETETWMYTNIDGKEGAIGKVTSQIEKIFNLKSDDYKVYIFDQEKDTDVPMHKDLSPCAIIIQLSEDHGPITFEEIGDIEYEAALVNTQKEHQVKSHKSNRIILKYCLQNKTYEECKYDKTCK